MWPRGCDAIPSICTGMMASTMCTRKQEVWRGESEGTHGQGGAIHTTAPYRRSWYVVPVDNAAEATLVGPTYAGGRDATVHRNTGGRAHLCGCRECPADNRADFRK